MAEAAPAAHSPAPSEVVLPTPSDPPAPAPVPDAADDSHTSAEPAADPSPSNADATPAPAQPAAVATATNNVATASTTPAPVAAPAPVKKFTPMSATRKFLEKTSSSTNVPTSTSTPASASSGGKTLARPAATPLPNAQPSTTSSKLVSAKLSMLGTPGPGTPSTWGRPPSAAASPAPAGSAAPSGSSPQQTQRKPQTRSTSPGKPAWGTPAANASARQAPNDFPTAAEAAEAARGWRERPARNAPAAPQEPSPEQLRSDAQNKALAETAAVFRGAHLDPNASHWDEMEEDEDFFQNPIEFGDGTQYKVDVPAEQPPPGQESMSPPRAPAQPNGAAKDDEEGWTQVSAKGGAVPSLASSATATTTSFATPSPHVSPHESLPPAPQRALYNDRSNRLEPYNGKPGRGGPAPHRRDSRLSDDGRETPPHRSPTVQLLRHAPGEHPPAKGPMRTLPSVYDRPPHERGRPGPGPGPEGHPPSRSGSGFHGPPPPSRRGTGDMGPPPPPPPARRGTGDMGPPAHRGGEWEGREAPPHLGRITPSTMTNGRDSPVSATSSRISTRERAPSIASSVAAMSVGKVAPPEPPAAAQPPPAPALSAAEHDELMKEYQRGLAEKARLRRVEEEAEREREKERARKKATELEERFAREKQEKEAAAAKAEAERKEAATKAEAERKEKAEAERQEREKVAAERQAAAAAAKAAAPPPPPPPDRARFDSVGSSRGTLFGRPRAPTDRNNAGFQPAPSVRVPSVINPPAPDPVMQLDSWRTNAAPPPPRPVPQKQDAADGPPKAPTPVSKPPPNFITSLFTNDFSLTADEDVEVLDFSELSKLAPPEVAQDSSETASGPPPGARPPVQLLQRPPGGPPPPGRPTGPLKSDTSAWRKPAAESSEPSASAPADGSPQLPAQQAVPPPSVWARRAQDAAAAQRVFPPPTLTTASKPAEPVAPTSPTTSPIRKHGRTISNEPMSPRQAPYKEAPLSALTDTMSRIKGALAGMQDAKGKDKESTSPALSPDLASVATFQPHATGSASRDREAKGQSIQLQLARETAALTQIALVVVPQPGEQTSVRLPPVSHHRETATKKQMHLWSSPTQVRFEILCWEPPVKGMSRRSLAVEDTLFDKAKMKQGATVYRVLLPSTRLVNSRALARIEASERQPAGGNAFSSRPSLVPPQGKQPSASFGRAAGASLFGVRSRGVDEASWRKPAAAKADPIVQTELNPVSRSPPPEPESQRPSAPKTQAPTAIATGVRVSQSGDVAKTPPVLTAHWGQSPLSLPIINSPSRQAPDPEHLKQVWSQALDKDGKPSGNSLQGIADEPTPLSFTMQEMKSEDGETPPPTMSSSSHSATSITRMSVADAHRAFQQVPTPSSSSSSPQLLHRPPPPPHSSSSHLSASPGRPPPPPMPMRVFYPQPPPGAPQPAPGAPGPQGYPMQHPQQLVQRPPVNGNAQHPQMAQGWVVGPAGAQQPQQFLRHPPGSPYLVAYAPPPGAMYGPPHPGQSPHALPKPGQPPMPQAPPGAGRGRGMPMMSPAPGPSQHISPVPTPGHIMQSPMGMSPYQGGPIPSIYHMPPPAHAQPMGHHLQQPQAPGQPMPAMYPGAPQRPPMMQYPSGGFVPGPPLPHFAPRPW